MLSNACTQSDGESLLACVMRHQIDGQHADVNNMIKLLIGSDVPGVLEWRVGVVCPYTCHPHSSVASHSRARM